VAAVVVYRPDARLLERALAAIAPQAGRVVVIVNDEGDWSCAMPPNAVVLRPGANIGLGAAYNLAVRRAREWGAARLLLLVQDSVAAPDMVEKLTRALSADPRAAAAGPLWHDSRTGRTASSCGSPAAARVRCICKAGRRITRRSQWTSDLVGIADLTRCH
jgi:rhamnosyltransferase